MNSGGIRKVAPVLCVLMGDCALLFAGVAWVETDLWGAFLIFQRRFSGSPPAQACLSTAGLLRRALFILLICRKYSTGS
jgi:hypothetical protein